MKRKLWAAFMAVLLVAGITGATLFSGNRTDAADESFQAVEDIESENKYYYGDANMDGKVAADDALLVLKHVAKIRGIEEGMAHTLADINEDQRITAVDALEILKTVAKLLDLRLYEASEADTPEPPDETEGAVVYMTTDISPESLMAVYEALGVELTGKVAVKISTGEPPASNYLRPELIKDLVQSVNGTIVECNTAYGGSRAQTAMHYQLAKDHGFTDIADFQILDEDGSMTLQVSGGSVLTENYVGAAFADYDSYLILSHFKGHSMAGFGGAIKNISIGLGSSEGKAWIHSGGTSRPNAWGGQQDAFLEAMAEA